MRVIVAMSGGIDSSCAAWLLREEGREVIGLTLRLPDDEPAARAARVCRALGIEHCTADVRAEFERSVVDPFCREYLRGRTPNPCIVCNRTIKFPSLMAEAARRGAERIATGHYARVTRGDDGRFQLRKGADPAKDQSYVLYTLTQDVLSRAIFPLGEWRKEQARAKAREFWPDRELPAESQEACFLRDLGHAAFIADRMRGAERPGDVVDASGKVLGRHAGVHGFTIGQRHGLGVAATGQPMYVLRIDAQTNTVVVGPREETYRREFVVRDIRWCSIAAPVEPLSATVKIRYAHPAAQAIIRPEADGARVEFAEPQHAITPGQSAVFYDGDVVLGGGIIE